MWIKQHRSGIVGAFGIALIVMAVAIPVVTPFAERTDVLIMTLLFSLVGAGMIYAAISERRTSAPHPDAHRAITADERARVLHARSHTSRNALGLGFAVFITLSGVLAPFVFPDVGPDERFAMMIGFAPVAIAGVVLVYVFWRALRPETRDAGTAPAGPAGMPRRADPDRPAAPRRAPVARVPRTALYGKLVPISIVALMVTVGLIVVFLAWVVVSAVLPLL